jgi:hypothetical protein
MDLRIKKPMMKLFYRICNDCNESEELILLNACSQCGIVKCVFNDSTDCILRNCTKCEVKNICATCMYHNRGNKFCCSINCKYK